MNKVAFVIGSGGQDGTYLTEFLARKKYTVIGIEKNLVTINKKKLRPVNIANFKEVEKLVKKYKPSEIYYVAAFHNSSEDKLLEMRELLEVSYEVNVFGLINFLEAIRLHSSSTKLFYASSCLIFGNTPTETQNEETPYLPNNPYAISKTDGLLISRMYRNDFKLFVSVGILYNHESLLRPKKFLSMKIADSVKQIKEGKQKELVLGSLSAEVDWGYAPDYVEAMWLSLQHSTPEEFIISTGIKHSVKEFVQLAFSEVGLDYKKFVKEKAGVLTRTRKPLVGNNSKIKKLLGWKPKVTFEEMVSILVKGIK